MSDTKILEVGDVLFRDSGHWGAINVKMYKVERVTRTQAILSNGYKCQREVLGLAGDRPFARGIPRSDGTFYLDNEFDRSLLAQQKAVSQLRSLANQIQIQASSVKLNGRDSGRAEKIGAFCKSLASAHLGLEKFLKEGES